MAAMSLAAKRKNSTPAPKSHRRVRGTGTIFPSKTRGWVGRVIVGVKPDGTPRYAERCARTQSALLKKLANVQPPGPTTTVSQWTARWLNSLDLAPRTLDSCRLSVRAYINPTLGRARLTALTAHQIEAAAKLWSQPAKNKNTGLSANTIRLVLAHLHTCLAAAVRAGILPTNPAKLAKKPKSQKAKIDPFSPRELARLIHEAAKEDPTRIVAFLAATGVREGEAIALSVTDFNAKAGTISISRGYRNSRYGVGPTKTANSVRTIRVPTPALPAVRDAIGKRTTGYLFASTSDRPKNHSSIRGPWKTLLKRLNLHWRNVHQLRHSVATAMISAGVPIGDVARYLGNTPAIVVKTYLHPAGVDPAAALEKLLGGGKVA